MRVATSTRAGIVPFAGALRWSERWLAMPLRLIVAYLLILLLAAAATGGIWRVVYNSPRNRMRRYYRQKHDRTKD